MQNSTKLARNSAELPICWAKITELTTTLHRSQIPYAMTRDIPGLSIRVQDRHVREDTAYSPVPRDPARGKAPTLSGDGNIDDTRPRESVHELLNLRTRRTATIDPREELRVHITSKILDMRHTTNGRNEVQQMERQTPLTHNLGSTLTMGGHSQMPATTSTY